MNVEETVASDSPAPSVKIRSFFPESWLSGKDDPDLPFGAVEMGDSNETTVSVTAPDTITTYQIYGYAVHPEKGWFPFAVILGTV